MTKLTKNNGAYIDENFDYMYIFDESMHTLKHVWMSEYAPSELTFPEINYEDNEFKIARNLEECKTIMEDPRKTLRKRQKHIVETIAQGKVNIGVGAFAGATKKEGVVCPIYLAITGNASIKFVPSSFGKAKVELILPRDMMLYKVM